QEDAATSAAAAGTAQAAGQRSQTVTAANATTSVGVDRAGRSARARRPGVATCAAGAVAGPIAGRYCYRAQELPLLFSHRYLHCDQRGADRHPVAGPVPWPLTTGRQSRPEGGGVLMSARAGVQRGIL